MTMIMQVMRVVSDKACRKPFQVSCLRVTAMTMVKKAPMAPASVGVKKPMKRPPMTSTKMMSVSETPVSDATFSLKENLGPLGPSSGLMVTQMSTAAMKNMVRMMPGRIPAMKSLPMDCSVRMPYTMKITLGGMRIPRLPAEATTPVASSGW